MEKQVLILGKGKSGQAAKKLLEKLGYKVYLWDEKDSLEILKGDYNFIVKSPGITPFKPYLEKIKDKLISELDLALLNSKGYKVGITGTNGKSTTTLLTYLLFKTLSELYPSYTSFIGGNFGNPFSKFAYFTHEKSISVLELSSFQLYDSKHLNFHVGAILNISEDHLTWHGSFTNYMESKLKLILNSKIKIMEEKTYLKYKVAFPKKIKNLSIITFGKSGKSSYSLKNNTIYTPNIQITLDDFPEIAEPPFAMDLLASLCIFENFVSKFLEIKLKDFYNLDFIKKTLSKYRKLPFRLEKRKLAFITIYNDSKSTNPHSVEWALKAIKEDVVLLMGGKDKGLCFNNLIPLIEKKVKAVFLFGEAKNSIYKQIKNSSYIEVCNSLEEAFLKALKFALKKDCSILFSPGCSSFDKFKNYLERGEYFDRLLKKYKYIVEERCLG